MTTTSRRRGCTSLRRRMLLSYLAVIGMVLLPLQIQVSYQQITSEFRLLTKSHLYEAQQLAALATGAVRDGAASTRLRAMLTRYANQTGGVAYVVDHTGRVLVSAPAGRHPTGDEQVPLRGALRGTESSNQAGNRLAALLRGDPLIVAQPVWRDDRAAGAVLLVTPGSTIRSRVGLPMFLLVTGAAMASAGAMLLAATLSRWVLRPIRRLNDAARQLNDGRSDAELLADGGYQTSRTAEFPTEASELHEALDAMMRRLKTTSQLHRTLAADLSHQLRNPLTALRVRVECLEHAVAEPDLPRLQAAVNEAERLGHVLDQLLALSTAQEQPKPSRPVSAREAAETRTRAWAAVATTRAVSLEVRGDDVPVAAAAGVLDQVLDVLLDNALRVSPAYSTVRVSIGEAAGAAVVEVTDQGPGMTDADKARACDRHWRRATPGQPGTGLGLAIASSLLEFSGGALSLHDAAPRGLLVRVHLPRWHEEVAEPGAQQRIVATGAA